MNATIHRQLHDRKRRIERRLDKTRVDGCAEPIFTAGTVQYQLGERTHGLAHGGIGALHALARQIGLINADDHLRL